MRKQKIICFGDSNTFGYDPRGYFGGRYDDPWPELLAGKLNRAVINLGENGRQIPEGTVDFPEDTDLLIVMLGTNDLLQGMSAAEVCGRMGRFLRRHAAMKILLVAPPPMKLGAWVSSQRLIADSAALAPQYQFLAEGIGARFADAGIWNIPLCFDGVHMTEQGHEIFADGLYKILTDC